MASHLARLIVVALACGVTAAAPQPVLRGARSEDDAAWTLRSDGPFSTREGLMAVSLGDYVYMTGGRDSAGTGFAADVWRSKDGATWEDITPSDDGASFFAPRAYHAMAVQGDCMVVIGGQTFDTFYADVWSSCDGGESWSELAANASWPERSGHALVATAAGELVLAGGCYNDASGTRSFRGDVWASADGGASWALRAEAPGWSARSGPRLVEFGGKLWIVAGERGFTPNAQLADVWSSADGGATWVEAAAAPAYSARSGHGVVVTPGGARMLLVAGWPQLHDLWATTDGVEWTQESDAVWGCTSRSTQIIGQCGKFDFWSLFHGGELLTVGGSGATSTFGKLYAETWAANASNWE